MFRNGIAWSLRLAPRHVNTLMAVPIGLSETFKCFDFDRVSARQAILCCTSRLGVVPKECDFNKATGSSVWNFLTAGYFKYVIAVTARAVLRGEPAVETHHFRIRAKARYRLACDTQNVARFIIVSTCDQHPIPLIAR